MKHKSIKYIAISHLVLFLSLFFLGTCIVGTAIGVWLSIRQERDEAINHLSILLAEIDFNELRRFFDETKNAYTKAEKDGSPFHIDFTTDKDYIDIRKKLSAVRMEARYKDISFVFYDRTNDCLVYVVNADEENVRSPGEWESCASGDVPDVSRMKKISTSPLSIDIRYGAKTGWRFSFYSPLGDPGEEFGCCVFDLYPKATTHYVKLLLVFSVPLFILLTLFVALLFVRFLRIYMIHPVVRISKATDRFTRLDSEALMNGSRVFAGLENGRKASKEILILTDNMKQLEERVAEALLEIRDMTEEKERIDTELSFAANIQRSMLPPIVDGNIKDDGFSLYAIMRPAREVGGDFYDFFRIDDDHLAFLVADVSDKGIGAALYMAISKSIIRSFAFSGDSPAQVLRDADAILSSGNTEGMFVTVFFGIMNLKTGEVKACNAGHDYPMVCFAGDDGYHILMEKHGCPLAFLPGMQFPQLDWKLSPGDRFFLYTDGINEAKVGNDERFGTERMVDILNEHKEQDDRTLCESMLAAVDSFADGNPQFDDITMLSVTYWGRE